MDAIPGLEVADPPEQLGADLVSEQAEGQSAYGLGDLEAAVAIVRGGLATRVVLTRLPTWPGLLTQVLALAREADVDIVATRVGPRGTVDLEVLGRATPDG